MHWLIAGGIALITWLFLNTCTNNLFTNWDDPGYIKDNPLIKDISGEGLTRIFTTPVMGNYHPLTILSYALEYSKVRLEPWLYHFDSLLLHILTTVLVYWFVQLLTKKPVAGIIAALLFGLHPMHMESVAWLAARKDVVYGVFYVAACIAYVYYCRDKERKKMWYAGTLVLFVLSLLGKPVAVVLPVTFLVIDYWEDRLLRAVPADAPKSPMLARMNWSAVIEKIPHFLIAVGFGIRSLKDQRTFGALDTQDVHYNFLERITLGFYAFITYLWKAVVPEGLSNFYPYPQKDGATLHMKYYLFPLAAIALLFLAWKVAKRQKAVAFGVLFYLVNIALLLQFLPVGGAIIADRYTYIPYLGLFFIAGWYVAKLFEGENKQYRTAAIAVCVLYVGYLGFRSNERCKDWYDTTSLWRDEIEKQPLAPNAYNNLGFNYFNLFNESVNADDKKRYADSANLLLHKAIELDYKFVNPMVSLGELNRASGRFPEAKQWYYKAISFNDKNGNANAYLGLAIIYSISQNFDSAGFCFRACIENKPYFPEAHGNFGNYFDMMSQQPGIDPSLKQRYADSSLMQYGIAIQQNPDMYAPRLNRARLYYHAKKYEEAMYDYNRAIELRPDMGEIYYWRSILYYDQGKRQQAIQDLDKAISLGFKEIHPAYYKALKGGR